MVPETLILIAAVIVSWSIAELVRRLSWRLNAIDTPNERSLHSTPTPRGGGLGIVLSSALAFLIVEQSTWMLILVCASLSVAVAGWIDDIKQLGIRIRLVVHLLSTTIFLAVLSSSYALNLNLGFITLEGVLSWAFALLAIVWLINLYNFMDGSDGIASVQAITTGFSVLVLSVFFEIGSVAILYAIMGASCLGFIFLNWQPAKIFMGDVGSGYLGFVLGSLSIYGEVSRQLPITVPLILLGVFVVDSAVTLIRRAIRGVKIYEAHREHAYQKAIQMGASHAQVAVYVGIVNLFFLAPLAYLSLKYPDWRWGVLLVAYFPLILITLMLNAGSSELKGRAGSNFA